jgi:hypothetical protein
MKPIARKIGGKVQDFAHRVSEKMTEFGGRKLGTKAEQLFKRSFMGLKPNTCYWDPTGALIDGGVNLCAKMQKEIQPAIDAFVEDVGNGYPIEEALWNYRQVGRKTLLASAWNIPVFAVRGTPIVNKGALPAATLLPRITTDKDEVQTTPLTSIGAAANIAAGDATYSYADDIYHGGTLAHYTFGVKGWGRGNKIDELMSLVGPSINNPRQSTAEAEMQALHRYLETQIIQGTHTGGGFSGNANGFAGIYNWSAYADFGYVKDMAGVALSAPDDLREAIDTLESNGANLDTVIGLTDRATLTSIKNDLQDYTRTENPLKNFVALDAPNNINIRSRCVVLDGVKIFQSYGSPTTAGIREVNFIDLSDHALAMVQDATLKPLAKVGPFEDMASDMFGTLISSGVAHCGRIHTIA